MTVSVMRLLISLLTTAWAAHPELRKAVNMCGSSMR